MGQKAKRNIFINFKRFVLTISLLLILINWAQAAEPLKVGSNNLSDYITLYPDKLTDREKALFEKWIAENKAIEDRGTVDVKALIAGTLPKDTPGIGPVLNVTSEMMLYQAKKYDPENPVLNDEAYAKKLGYENIIAYPTFAPNDDAVMKAYPAESRDKLLVSDLNHNITYYKPIYPGDTLYTVINKRIYKDITSKKGSIFRSIAIQSEASIYNQKGEKVNDAIFRVTENIGILKPGVTAVSDGGPMPAWVSPAWTNRPAHKYTDDDWKKIKDIWKNEKRQGATPLYWEDVKVGDYTTQTVDGPVMQSVMPTQPYGMGTGGSRTLKKEIMDPAIFKTMHQDENGIWLTANQSDYIPATPSTGGRGEGAPAQGGAPSSGDQSGRQGGAPGAGSPSSGNPGSAPDGGSAGSGDIDTTQLHKTVGTQRSVLFNFMGRDFAIRNINAWMGDKGLLYNIRWSIMAPSAINKAVSGVNIPNSPLSERYVEKVPKLKTAGSVMNAHGLTYDAGIVQAYIEKKYEKNGEHFVDLVWWVEDIVGNIWEEGGATVKLPSKNTK